MNESGRTEPEPGQAPATARGVLEAPNSPSPNRETSQPTAPRKRSLLRIPVFLVRYGLGALFCQSLLGSILILGWTMRIARRTILKAWWRRSASPHKEADFDAFLLRDGTTAGQAGFPNLVRGQNLSAWESCRQTADRRALRNLGRALFCSLAQNMKIGLQSILTTWAITLPGCALWFFSWYDGWNNSFNKGYEQAAVGPATGIAGVFLFIGAMFYAPMAQMRQASTGDWRAFFEFGKVRDLIRKNWLACFGLAALCSLLSFPAFLLKTAPAFFTNAEPGWADLTAPEALRILKAWFFWAGFYILPAFILLRIVAAKIYASSVLACAQSGLWNEDSLSENEWGALRRLGLLEALPRPRRHPLLRLAAWVGTRVGRATVVFGTFLAWFTLVAQIYTSEFFIKAEYGKGWLNQPLVQLPWFTYIPSALRDADATELPGRR